MVGTGWTAFPYISTSRHIWASSWAYLFSHNRFIHSSIFLLMKQTGQLHILRYLSNFCLIFVAHFWSDCQKRLVYSHLRSSIRRNVNSAENSRSIRALAFFHHFVWSFEWIWKVAFYAVIAERYRSFWGQLSRYIFFLFSIFY